jgi:hypothetical protein
MRNIQAYFRTENDAEDARVRLIPYRAIQVEVGRLSEGLDRSVPLIVPFGMDGSLSGVGSPNVPAGGPALGTAAYTAFRPLETAGLDDEDGDLDRGALTYTLSAKVDPADYEEVIRVLRENRGHVVKFD